MIENENKLKEVLNVLYKENILPNVVLIGSWCLIFYEHIFNNFEATVRTTDIDFYVPNIKSVREKNNLINSFKMINYDIVKDTMTQKSTFISPDGFELEFLTKLNREQLSAVEVGNTNVYAESLSYIELLSLNYIEVLYDGMMINVVSPASYVLQKLLINKDRKNKKEKDIESIKNVLFYIGASIKYCDELKQTYDSLPKKWKKRIDETCNENNIALPFLIDN